DRHGVALVPTQARGPLTEEVGRAGWLGVALARRDLSDLARAHRLAAPGLERAPARALALRPVLDDLDAAVGATLGGHPDRLEAPDVLLRAALTGQAKVREGLEAYLGTGSAVAAAE